MALTLDDRAELHDLYARYAYAIDGDEGDAWAALFTPDGRFEPPGADPVVGTAALSAFVSARSAATPGLRHLMSNIVVEASGAGATGRAYFICFRLGGDGKFRLRNLGRYDDRFARGADGWRIELRQVVSELDIDLVDAAFDFTTG